MKKFKLILLMFFINFYNQTLTISPMLIFGGALSSLGIIRFFKGCYKIIKKPIIALPTVFYAGYIHHKVEYKITEDPFIRNLFEGKYSKYIYLEKTDNQIKIEITLNNNKDMVEFFYRFINDFRGSNETFINTLKMICIINKLCPSNYTYYLIYQNINPYLKEIRKILNKTINDNNIEKIKEDINNKREKYEGYFNSLKQLFFEKKGQIIDELDNNFNLNNYKFNPTISSAKYNDKKLIITLKQDVNFNNNIGISELNIDENENFIKEIRKDILKDIQNNEFSFIH